MGLWESPVSDIPSEIAAKIEALGLRPGERVRPVILELCRWKALSASQLASTLGRPDSKALKRDHLAPMIAEKQLEYTHPDMERHPHQAYHVPTDAQASSD